MAVETDAELERDENPWERMIIALIIVMGIVLLLAVYFGLRKRNKRAEASERAAAVLNSYLELDNVIGGRNMRDRVKSRIFLDISWRDGGRQEYVFDPEQGIKIGYDPDRNNIALLDKAVSDEHCILFLYGRDIYVQDLHSTNGTWVRHGLRKKE